MMTTTFGFIAERASSYPVIMRRGQMSKVVFVSDTLRKERGGQRKD